MPGTTDKDAVGAGLVPGRQGIMAGGHQGPHGPADRAASGAALDPARAGLVAAALVAASLAAHLLLAGWTALSPQEAYYWQYARHLDLSYFDHPPLAAWTIRATTALLGATERGVRAAAALHAALFATFFFLAGRRLFGARAALAALAAGLLVPVLALGQTVITPDAPLLSGWAAALYFTVRALDEERGSWLLAAGAAVGWASLGKYTGALLAPQILLVLALDARGRRLLRSPWPYAGLALALVLFSPVVAWNARHGWVSFRFQFGQRGAGMGSFSPARLGRFVGLQALAVSPVLFVALVAALGAAARRWRERGFAVCAAFSLPALAAFTAVSPFLWVKGNWPAPAWPTALLAAAALWTERPRALRAAAVAALGTAAALTLYLHLAPFAPALPFPAHDDVVSGWKELAARVEAERARLAPPAFVLGCGYKPASELAFYLPDRPETVGQNAMGEDGLQYRFWLAPGALAGREGLLVVDRREGRSCLRRAEVCQPLEQLPSLEVRRGRDLVTTFDLWRCRFRAGGHGDAT